MSNDSAFNDKTVKKSADFEQSASSASDDAWQMTVHDLPHMGATGAVDASNTPIKHINRRMSRLKMLLILMICASPVIASYFTFYVIQPRNHPRYGELITPTRSLPAVPATTLDGAAAALTDLRGQWLLISTSTASCDTQCEAHLYLQRQLRETLGKDKDRLDWVWLISDTAPVRQALLPAAAQAQVRRVAASDLAAWLPAAPGHTASDHLYVVDPMGELMMRLPANLGVEQAAQAKRDIERLLRASRFWDTAGRAS